MENLFFHGCFGLFLVTSILILCFYSNSNELLIIVIAKTGFLNYLKLLCKPLFLFSQRVLGFVD